MQIWKSKCPFFHCRRRRAKLSVQRQSGWRVDPLSCCHPAAERPSPSESPRWVLRPVRALCCVPLRYLFPPLICQTLRHKHTLPLSIYLTPISNSSLRPAPERRVCAQGEKGGESALVIICNTRGMKRGCFPGGSSIFLKLRFISLFSLTFWPSWEAVVSQWRPNRRIAPLPTLLRLFCQVSPLTANVCERLSRSFPFYNRWPHQPNQLLLILIDDK